MKTDSVIDIYKLPEVPNVCRQILREAWQSKNVSVAHVIMRPKEVSLSHKHMKFTELYYILEGEGVMWLGEEKFGVKEGSLVEVRPNTAHKLENTGKSTLKHLVISTPAFSPDDVVLLEKARE